MVSVQTQPHLAQITLRPNCSADWQSNRRILFFIASLNLILASGLILMGAWLVLPFMGLELWLLWCLLRKVFRKLQFQQVLKLDDEQLSIESGFLYPDQQWRWPRREATVLVTTCQHPLEPLQLSLSHRGEEVEIGRFLNKDDSQALLNALRDAGLMIRQFSPTGQFTA